MSDRVRALWTGQNRHPGDRARLFRAVGDAVEAAHVLCPGSFVDVSPSFVLPSVTYVDLDDRAARFFAQRESVAAIVAEHRDSPGDPEIHFLHGDYAGHLDLPRGGFDLLVSLYAGLVSEHCTEYLKPGGTLLANPSHGDVAMASLDDRYVLSGVVVHRGGASRVRTTGLEQYLVPKASTPLTRDDVRERGRGVAYTRSAFAYLFTHR